MDQRNVIHPLWMHASLMIIPSLSPPPSLCLRPPGEVRLLPRERCQGGGQVHPGPGHADQEVSGASCAAAAAAVTPTAAAATAAAAAAAAAGPGGEERLWPPNFHLLPPLLPLLPGAHGSRPGGPEGWRSSRAGVRGAVGGGAACQAAARSQRGLGSRPAR